MFEKEAEKWVKENMDCCKTDNSVNQSIPYFDEEERCCAKSAFQDGAEFGYNKANEWHFVKDGDLPKVSGRYLVYTGGEPFTLDFDTELNAFGYWCLDVGEHLKKEYAKENKVPKYENYMRGDIELLINCDAIYLLENWGTSKGARLEKKIAEVLKMQIMTD